MVFKSMKTVLKIIYVVIIVILVSIICIKLNKGKTIITSNSSLIKVEDKEDLYVARFEYGGIAYLERGKEELYLNEDERVNADLKIKYNAVINAKVDLKELERTKKIENKKIYLNEPIIEYIITILSDSEDSEEKNFETIGNNSNYSWSTLLTACEVDVKNEINNNTELKEKIMVTAKDTIEGLLYYNDYEIVWKDGD